MDFAKRHRFTQIIQRKKKVNPQRANCLNNTAKSSSQKAGGGGRFRALSQAGKQHRGNLVRCLSQGCAKLQGGRSSVNPAVFGTLPQSATAVSLYGRDARLPWQETHFLINASPLWQCGLEKKKKPKTQTHTASKRKTQPTKT